MEITASQTCFFENDGDGHFFDISEIAGIQASGERIHRSAIFADYDNDGLVDIYVANNGQQVEAGKGNTIADEAQGDRSSFPTANRKRKIGGLTNRDAYGAEVTVTAGDLVLIQALISGTSYFSTNVRALYFGIGMSDKIDRLEIKWPSGIMQTFDNLENNQTILIIEGKEIFKFFNSNDTCVQSYGRGKCLIRTCWVEE